jgi:hypothetical protein
VGLSTTTVVRLECALAHFKSPWIFWTPNGVQDNLSNLRHNKQWSQAVNQKLVLIESLLTILPKKPARHAEPI